MNIQYFDGKNFMYVLTHSVLMVSATTMCSFLRIVDVLNNPFFLGLGPMWHSMKFVLGPTSDISLFYGES